jgi:hypothetical protein
MGRHVVSADIANMALRSIIRQVAATPAGEYDIGYLRGQIVAMRTYFDTDPELVKEAHAAVDELRRKISN